MFYYHITIIGHLRMATGTSGIYQPVGYFPSRESAWKFLTGKFGADTAALMGESWEVSKVSESAIPDDAWEGGEVMA